MYLQKLEIQGFKSFAARTILEFPSATGQGKGMTAIVGPNGSGKSNIADAVRWVLGEQSMKTLRGKKGEDVIFFGSDKKARVGMAEVSLHLNNEDPSFASTFVKTTADKKVLEGKPNAVDFPEIVITRRLYRNGESEYLLNRRNVRLLDIQLLLAKANFGQRTYSVIGQGMVDHFLVASQAERKEFFDEAAGVKEYQIKKNQTINQLENARTNLKQTEITLGELGPRYRSLARMMKRLSERAEVETELRGLQTTYYGTRYAEIKQKFSEQQKIEQKISGELSGKRQELSAIQEKLNALEQEDSSQDAFNNLQRDFNKVLEKKNQLWQKQLEVQGKINLARQQAKTDFVPLTVDEMALEIETLLGLHDELSGHLESVKELTQLSGAQEKVKKVIERLRQLLKKVRRPGDEEVAVDAALESALVVVREEIKAVEIELTAAQKSIAEFNKSRDEKKGEFFDLQRNFSAKQSEINALAISANDAKIEMAKLETRKEDLEREIEREMNGSLPEEMATMLGETELAQNYDKIQKLKHQLELIGGVDEESVKEFDEIKVRFEFLQEQFEDLNKAIASLEEIIKKLDGEIHERFDKTFSAINQKFGEYFRKLFDGGKASLEKIMFEVSDESTVQSPESGDESTVQSPESREERRKLGTKDSGLRTKREYQYGGVDIVACPPGKKISNLQTLSGGERAMASIALICAIIACNPSPFVVLDEVDAALDEANSERLAAILEELSSHTQFIVVTHNRASMRRADILYGVTMGDDSASRLLSVKLEEGEQWAK